MNILPLANQHICAVKDDLHIVDTANDTISLLFGTQGIVILANIGYGYDIFSVHSSNTMPLNTAAQHLRDVIH